MTATAARTLPVTPTDLPCRKLGSQCRALRVTLRVGSLEEGDTSLDHEATWLRGHTEHITFGDLWWGEGDLYVDPTDLERLLGRPATPLADAVKVALA